jgi:cytochrome c biogenesis protein CcmG, thiol:disulfide interchange protein DsbE
MSFDQAAAIPSNRTRKNALIIFGLILIVFAALFGLLLYGLAVKNAPPLAAGQAPPFELTTFDGQQISSAGLHGKPVVINFWASWCIPCRDEAPYLRSAWEKYKARGLVIVGVDYVDTDPEAKKFLADFGETYPNGSDVGTRISQAYRISGVPETYFITRNGNLLPGEDADGHANGNWIGPLSQSALEDRIQLLIGE